MFYTAWTTVNNLYEEVSIDDIWLFLQFGSCAGTYESFEGRAHVQFGFYPEYSVIDLLLRQEVQVDELPVVPPGPQGTLDVVVVAGIPAEDHKTTWLENRYTEVFLRLLFTVSPRRWIQFAKKKSWSMRAYAYIA